MNSLPGKEEFRIDLLDLEVGVMDSLVGMGSLRDI